MKHPRDDNFADFDLGTILIFSSNAKYKAEFVVGITKNGDAVFYDVVDMEPTTFDIKETEASPTVTTQNTIDSTYETSAKNIVLNPNEKVNTEIKPYPLFYLYL